MATDEAREIIRGAGHGMLATAVDGQPRVRPMAFAVTDDFRLLSSTFRRSGKAKELAANGRVEICFLDARNYQLRIEGRADVSGGPERKRELLALNPRIRKHFKDEHDPEFVLIEIVPTRARWMPPGFGEYREVEIHGTGAPRTR
jgi:general stress protein 26